MCKEAYFGCECGCLNHVIRFNYYPPRTPEEEKSEENVIYFTVTAKNYFNRFFPYISIKYPLEIFERDTWRDWRHFHFFHRFSIAFKHIINSYYAKKYGVLDCMDFQKKDLGLLYGFLRHLTKDINISRGLQQVVYLNNEKWELRFTIMPFDDYYLYRLGWEIQFIPKNLCSRIKNAFKYIFGRNCDEQGFEINQKQASKLKGMITTIKKANAKEEAFKNENNFKRK